MNGELLTALERIEREKGIEKNILFEAIESALVSAARKVIDDPNVEKEDITVNVDRETGEIKVSSGGEEIESERFGRIAAQTAKQVIIQKIREAERDVVSGKYQKRVGTIVSGAVHRFEKGNVIVDMGDAEAVLAKQEQIPRERFRQGETVRAYLAKVDTSRGAPEVVLSRTDAGFVKKLFELEVPEISQGIVEIKGIAREAGERTKIAVHSKDEKVDPVGACVGMRGARVRDIVKELHGERIDIVRWNDDIREYLVAAMNPAEISKMAIDRENKHITVFVRRDQLSLAIGKKGRNIRLASKLLGWELNVESEITVDLPLKDVEGITAKQLKTLEEAGYETAAAVMKAGQDALLNLDGVGEKTAENILTACKAALIKADEEEAAKAAKAAEEKEGARDTGEAGAPEVSPGSGTSEENTEPEEKLEERPEE